MRAPNIVLATIVALSVVVVGLAVLILLDRPPPLQAGPVFDASRLIADARAGESATYRDEQGNTWTFRVESATPGGVERMPKVRVWSVRKNRNGQPLDGGTHVYEHETTKHGLFPLMAPQEPDGYDRIWVWHRIRRDVTGLRGQETEAWRVDLVDPGLPEKGGGDHVVAWLSESVPVFGLLRWQRRGRTWALADWSPR